MYPPLKKLLESPTLCFSLQMIFVCSLVTGGEEFPHKEPPGHGAINRHCQATLVWKLIVFFLVLAFANPENLSSQA